MAGYYGITLIVHVSVCPSTRLLVIPPSVFLFQDDNFGKFQWIFNKLGICIDIVEIWLGIANGQISSIFFMELPARDTSIFSVLDNNLSKCQSIFTKLGICIDTVEIWFGIANGQILSIFDGVIRLRHVHILVSGQYLE